MTELFLVAHKVRGEPAFDVASRMRCPNCHGVGGYRVADFETGEIIDYEGAECSECNGEGFWWIVPTSGHRAYPYWDCRLDECLVMGMGEYEAITCGVPDMPPALPDHYTSRAATVVPSGLAALLAKRKPMNVERRGR